MFLHVVETRPVAEIVCVIFIIGVIRSKANTLWEVISGRQDSPILLDAALRVRKTHGLCKSPNFPRDGRNHHDHRFHAVLCGVQTMIDNLTVPVPITQTSVYM